jgi:hypothetical protein
VCPATVKIVVPSVLTLSGSSTPSSCTLVVEYDGVASFPEVTSGAAGGVVVATGIVGSAMPGTTCSTTPWVRARLRCA